MSIRQMILVYSLAVGIFASASIANATIVRLHSIATVDKTLIQLGDVADVFSDNKQTAASLKNITLRTSPIPGNSTRLRLDEIRSRLLKFDVEVGAIEFQGHNVVLVTRRGHITAASQPTFRSKLASATNQSSFKPRPLRKTELASHRSNAPRTFSSMRDVSTADIRLAETVIHDLVRDYMSEWAADWGTPVITPLLAIPTVPKLLSAHSGNLKIVSGRPLSDDIFLLKIAIPTGSVSKTEQGAGMTPSVKASIETVDVRVRVTRRPKVLAARRSIAQGQVIREADLEWREVDDLRNGTSEPETVVGMEARRTIRKGDFVKVSSVKPPTMIKRDELVKVAVTRGSVRVIRTLQARRDCILNDIISLVPPKGSTGEPLPVRVTGRGKAEPLDIESDNEKPQIRLTRGDGQPAENSPANSKPRSIPQTAQVGT